MRAFHEQAEKVERLEEELAREMQLLEQIASVLAQQDSFEERGGRVSMRDTSGSPYERFARRGPVGIRTALINIMRQRPGGPWSPTELQTRLEERGQPTSRSNLQTTLARMLKDGQIAKLHRGAYRLAEASAKGVPETE